jgi:hypothetical protein
MVTTCLKSLNNQTIIILALSSELRTKDFRIKTQNKVVFVHYAMKMYGRVDVQIQVYLTSASVGGGWLSSIPSRFFPREKPLYPLDRRLSGSQSRLGRYRELKILDPTGT